MPPVDLLEIYHALLNHFRHRNWWPGETQLEIIVGAILTQNTAWKNVEKAIARLKEAGVLSLKALRAIPLEDLAELIRPSGYYNQKALKLKAFLAFLQREYRGSLTRMFKEDTSPAGKLLKVKASGERRLDSALRGRPFDLRGGSLYGVPATAGFGRDQLRELQEFSKTIRPDVGLAAISMAWR